MRIKILLTMTSLQVHTKSFKWGMVVCQNYTVLRRSNASEFQQNSWLFFGFWRDFSWNKVSRKFPCIFVMPILVFMWSNHIIKLNITLPSEVLVSSDKRPYRNLTFHNVLAWQGSFYCNRARLNFQAFAFHVMTWQWKPKKAVAEFKKE